MMSSTTTARMSRFRPVILAASGIAVACAIYFIHQRHATPPQGTLHRSNAIRRTGSQRRRQREGTNGHAVPDLRLLERQEAVGALANLEDKEHAHSTYGDISFVDLLSRFNLAPGPDAPAYCVLIPSQLPRAEELVQRGFSESLAPIVRQFIEYQFVLTFLLTEMPDGVIIASAEATYFGNQLAPHGIRERMTLASVRKFNETAAQRLTHRTPLRLPTPPPLDGVEDGQPLFQAAVGLTESQSDSGWQEGMGNTNPSSSGQDMLTLLYHIAEDNAKKEHIVHRGVQCNACSMMPLRGVRYRCANCADYDLCESCESMQIHIKTHVFYKIRIPTPWNTGPKQPAPVWYPGKPHMMPLNPSTELMKKLVEQTGFEHSHLETFWEQFRVIASSEWPEDPDNIGVAIDRRTFDRAFLPGTASRPPPPNLIFDRLFAFYDINCDGLIGFTEFVTVQVWLEGKTRDAKLRRIFFGYDLNNDGFVDRKDFLRMFRAWYALKKEYMRDVLVDMQDDTLQNDLRETISGSQPISSAFIGAIHPGHDSREGEGKRLRNGDLVIVDDEGILREDAMDQYSRSTLVHDLEHDRSKDLRDSQTRDLLKCLRTVTDLTDETNLFLAGNEVPWPPTPPFELTGADFYTALGAIGPVEGVMDPADRARLYLALLDRWKDETDVEAKDAGQRAILNRWQRREFYTDVEEGATKPVASCSEQNSSDESDDDLPHQNGSASGSRPLSPRSRSSSKVRFEDSITDTDYETRSNTSQRSIPVGERWGGYEIAEAEKDIGREALYLAVSEGFNELLDELFLEKEDAGMKAQKTARLRAMYIKEIQWYEKNYSQNQRSTQRKQKGWASRSEQGATTSKRNHSESGIEQAADPALSTLLEQSGYTVDNTLSPQRNQTEEAHHKTSTLPPLDQNAAETSTKERQDFFSAYEIDPTLPQNRPNSPSFERSTLFPIENDYSTPLHSPEEPSSVPGVWNSQTAESSKTSFEFTPPEPVVRSLLEDERTDREASERGGYGRINFDEFVQKMVPDGFVGTNEGDKVGTGGMRKLGFVSAWIEMAGFF